MDKNQVIIRPRSVVAYGIYLAVHPFSFERDTVLMYHKGDYGRSSAGDMLPWQCSLADALWDSIPGLQSLFFSNGEITIHHNGLFPDDEVIDQATKAITPYLMSNQLMEDWDKEAS